MVAEQTTDSYLTGVQVLVDFTNRRHDRATKLLEAARIGVRVARARPEGKFKARASRLCEPLTLL